MLIDLFARLLKEAKLDHRHLRSFTVLLTFFAHINPNLDKKLLAYLSNLPKQEMKHFNHLQLRTLGIILLSNNMPRSSSYFFYKPRKEAKKIKFLTYFECCKRLASIKVTRRTIKVDEELKRSKNQQIIEISNFSIF